MFPKRSSKAFNPRPVSSGRSGRGRGAGGRGSGVRQVNTSGRGGHDGGRGGGRGTIRQDRSPSMDERDRSHSMDESKGITTRNRGSSTEESKAANFVSTVRACGIEVVVYDMDRTLTSLHSGGSLPRSQLSQFKSSISPTARVTIPQLLAAGIRVAVATFSDDLYTTPGIFMAPEDASMQIAGQALATSVLGSFLSPEEIAQIPLITLNPNLYTAQYRQVLESLFLEKIAGIAEKHGCSPQELASKVGSYPPPKDKTWHLRTLCEIFGLPPAKLCLIDDSRDNVRSALILGCAGIEVHEREGLEWEDLCHIIAPPGSSTSKNSRRKKLRK